MRRRHMWTAKCAPRGEVSNEPGARRMRCRGAELGLPIRPAHPSSSSGMARTGPSSQFHGSFLLQKLALSKIISNFVITFKTAANLD